MFYFRAKARTECVHAIECMHGNGTYSFFFPYPLMSENFTFIIIQEY